MNAQGENGQGENGQANRGQANKGTPSEAELFLRRLLAQIMELPLKVKLLGAGAIALVAAVALALWLTQEREINVNGYRLGELEIAYLDRIAGAKVADGDYWYDPQTTAWGLVGNAQIMGFVREPGAVAPPPTPTPPQSWGDVGESYRGPFGDYMSDGQCSFVNGVAVGDC